MTDPNSPAETESPAALLRQVPSLSALARAAGLDIKTLLIARDANAWPAHRRTREALRRALGLEPGHPPVFPIMINSVEECEAVLARLKANQPAPQPIADAIPQPV
jgi:hypothetical protein